METGMAFHYTHILIALVIIALPLGFLAVKIENFYQQIAVSIIAGGIIFIATEMLHFM